MFPLTPSKRAPESDITGIAEKVWNQERLSADDALRLFSHPNLDELALLVEDEMVDFFVEHPDFKLGL